MVERPKRVSGAFENTKREETNPPHPAIAFDTLSCLLLFVANTKTTESSKIGLPDSMEEGEKDEVGGTT